MGIQTWMLVLESISSVSANAVAASNFSAPDIIVGKYPENYP